ncbi:hypothetical protein BC829DRAFT_86784 [Chytridium lagenaria]|nr:hypothetical protein BC829DRAFT_86784 [Chytridium lagenaria]
MYFGASFLFSFSWLKVGIVNVCFHEGESDTWPRLKTCHFPSKVHSKHLPSKSHSSFKNTSTQRRYINQSLSTPPLPPHFHPSHHHIQPFSITYTLKPCPPSPPTPTPQRPLPNPTSTPSTPSQNISSNTHPAVSTSPHHHHLPKPPSRSPTSTYGYPA